MANCPTCGRAMLSEWPHDHRTTADPDAALREVLHIRYLEARTDEERETVWQNILLNDKRLPAKRPRRHRAALAATASPGEA